MFQYNLKTLLLVMLGACLLTWLFFVLPGEIGVAILMCLLAIVPSAEIAGILYFRGVPQAFAIGCVPPMLFIGCLFLFDGAPWRYGPNDALSLKLMILVWLLITLGGGAIPVRLVPVRTQQLSERIAGLQGDAHAVGALDARVGIAQVVRMDDRHGISAAGSGKGRKGTNGWRPVQDNNPQHR